MKLFEGKSPSERNKIIAAIALGVVALASIVFMFVSSPSSSKSKNQNSNVNRTKRPDDPADLVQSRTGNLPSPSQAREDAETLTPPKPVVFSPSSDVAPEAGRNIFAFYVPPPPTPTPPLTPTPTPTPPMLLASMSPANVFARTGDFTLEVYGDKFTPESAILVDNSPLPTKYLNAQQLSATVPGSMIANDGGRRISISTPDGRLYSLPMTLTVTPPPAPNYLYVGIIGKAHYNDTAVLKDKSNPKELLNVQRGDTIGGRFRVTSISEREIALTDTTLSIKHTLPFVEDRGTGQAAGPRPTINTGPLGSTESGIPGIPNVPRYQPPGRAEQDLQENDEGEEIPGIPGKVNKP
jgi:hypothetical protein